MVAQFVAASRGVGDIQRNLYWPDLRRAIVIIPPPDEQAAIVRFLDHANQKIDRFIRAKRKLIALLNEQKQAIIHRAVTRGLNPNAPLKRSGIPWLDDIPEQWDVRRNGRLFKERIENGKTGLPVLIVSLRTGVTIGSGTNEAGRERRLIADATAYKLACQNDIAYNMMRMWQGAVGVVPELGLVSPAYVVAKPLEGVCSSYYELLFRTDACKGEINRNSRGIVSDRNRLYWEDFKQLTSPVPPYDEQIKIVESLSNQFIEVDQVIARTEREIALMQEYRTRLTAEVVTGKLDVREAAAKLPDTTDSTNDTDSYNSDTDEEEFDADTSEE
jgi:type I restriction enzyme S subunit